MSFDQYGHGHEPAASSAAAECGRETTETLNQASRACFELGQGIEQQWPDIPEHAVKYLAANCQNHLPLAISEARKALTEDSEAFDDPDIASFLLDDCIAAAKNQTARHTTNQKIEKSAAVEIEQKEVGAAIEKLKMRIAGNLTGSDKLGQLNKLILDVTASDHFSAKEKGATLKQLGQIRANLAAMSQMGVSGQEKAVLSQIIAQSNLNLGAASQYMVFSDVLAQVDSSPEVSEETKQNMQKLFGVQTIETGTDIQNTLNQGRGLGENGGKLPFDKDHKARVDRNTYIYEKPDGERVVEVNLPDGRNLKTNFAGEASPDHVTDVAFTLRSIMAAEALNLGEAIFQRGWKISHGGTIDLHYDDIITAKRLGGLFLGEMTGYDGNIMTAADISRLQHDYQAFSSQGDWATGDNDPVRQRADFMELGTISDDGSINWRQLERAARYLQIKTSQGGIPDFGDLKRYLTGGNSQIE